MINKIMDLSQRLISIPSTRENPDQLKKIINFCQDFLKDFSQEYFESNNIPSLLVYNTKTRPKKFKIILNGHLDVVPAKAEQFKPHEKNGKLYGRGTNDMKTATAVLMLIFQELAKKINYPLALQLTTDEEVGGLNGVKYQIKKEVRADFFITGESTDLNIKNEAKGVIWLKLTTFGKAAHGAYPWLGDNALWKLITVLNQIQKKFPLTLKNHWQTTVNLATITTLNTSFNRIPDSASATIDIRYIPKEAKTIQEKIKSLIPKGVKLEFATNEPYHYSNMNNVYSKTLSKVIKKITGQPPKITKGHGASDARHYSEKGILGIEFGPTGEGLHSDNECVEIKSLEKYYQILKEFLLEIK